MAQGGLSYRTRRTLSLLVLVVGLPVYIVLAIMLVDWLGRPGIVVEFLIYVALGTAWALPLRAIFRGVGRADPDDDAGDESGR